MKKILIFILSTLFVCDLSAQSFPKLSDVSQYITDSVKKRPDKITANTLNKAYQGVIAFMPDIVQDTASVASPKHGWIRFQRKDSNAYVYDTIGARRWRKYVFSTGSGGAGTDNASYHSMTRLPDSASVTFDRPNGTKDTLTVRLGDSSVTDRKIAPGIDATKIGVGDVNNAKIQYLNSLTGNVQTQLNNKLDSAKLRNDTLLTYKNGVETAHGKATGSGGGGPPFTFSKIKFVWGVSTNAPTSGNIFQNDSLIGKQVEIFRMGDFQDDSTITYGYQFNSTTGTVTFSPTPSIGESINIKIYPAGTVTYYSLPAPVSYDTDAQAYFTAEEAAGGTITLTQKDATNAFVVGLKADGIWTNWNVIRPMVGTCTKNLKNLSKNATLVNSPTINSAGITYNGTNQKAALNYIPSSDGISLNEGVFAFIISGGTAGTPYGANATGADYFFQEAVSTNASQQLNGAGQNPNIDTRTGRFIMSRHVNTFVDVTIDMNGVQKSINSQAVGSATGALPGVEVYEGCFNNNGFDAGFYNGTIGLLMIGSTGLTPTQRAALDARMATFKTAMGR